LLIARLYLRFEPKSISSTAKTIYMLGVGHLFPKTSSANSFLSSIVWNLYVCYRYLWRFRPDDVL